MPRRAVPCYALQVGFGEDVSLLLSDKSTGIWTAFEAVGRHVAYFVDNVPM